MHLLARSGWRHLWRHPWQLVLIVVGVALGVAVVVAVDLAITSAQRSFVLSMESVTGRATDQIVGGPMGLNEQLYVRLRVSGDVPALAPVVEGYGKAGRETLHLLGVDPFAESEFRAHLEDIRAPALRGLLSEPGAVALAASTAERLRLQVGQRFSVRFSGREHNVVLVGLLPARGRHGVAMDGLLIADIATAQELLGDLGRLNRIDLILPSGAAGERLRRHIAGSLPPDATIVPAETRTETLAQMTRAFRTNLTAMSLLALIVGTFLIYNTVTFAVLQRRRLIGAWRVLGVSRAEVFRHVLAEAVAVGLLGTLIGLVLGILLGQGLVGLVTRTINDLYFVLTVSKALVTPVPLIKGAVLGISAAAAAALLPAIEAAGTAPQTALRRSQLEERVRRLAPRLAFGGGAMVLGALAVLSLPTKELLPGFIALFLLILGLTVMTPLAVTSMVTVVEPLLRRSEHSRTALLRWAVRGIRASLSRTGVAIAALTLAVATTIGVGIMVDSFRRTVETWLDSTLRADIYIGAPSIMSSRRLTPLDPRILRQIQPVPGVAFIAGTRSVNVETADGITELLAIEIPPAHATRYLLKQGDPESAWAAFRQGRAVFVTEPYAYRHGVKAGDLIDLRTASGRKHFPVAGVLYDYGSEQGLVLMNRALYVREFHDPSLTSLRLYLKPGVSPQTVMSELRATIHVDQTVLIRSNRDIRAISLEIFDRTFTITNVLRLLAVLVAFVGILSAFMALSLERTRELAVLRASGVTPREVQGIVVAQTGLMGLAAGLLAWPLGLTLALLLIHVINRRAFGWTMQTSIDPVVLLEGLLLAVVAALIAGLYPGWRMARVSPAEALREE